MNLAVALRPREIVEILEGNGMEGLAGRVAVITGANSGIGRGIAFKLAALGVKVVLNGRDPAKGQTAVSELRNAGHDAHFVAGDVRSREDMDRLVSEALDKYGCIDCMVSSAGAWPSGLNRPEGKFYGPFQDLDIDDVGAFVGGVTMGKLMPVRAVAPHMISRKSGSVVFITSEGGRFPTPGQTAIAAHAAGLIMATKVIAKEMAQHKVRVNCIAVSVIDDTSVGEDVNDGTAPRDERAKRYAKVRERAPFGLAQTSDIASVAAFLLSDSAGFITGSTVSPTGGLTYS
ncbi:MAG TPA: SDR family NAD(P)-dependent oxidoreductase [Ramlibacter sp.]|nr:SDR family NAD(P)-dependent oxidoreductase [Ramlibacter sp.]